MLSQRTWNVLKRNHVDLQGIKLLVNVKKTMLPSLLKLCINMQLYSKNVTLVNFWTILTWTLKLFNSGYGDKIKVDWILCKTNLTFCLIFMNRNYFTVSEIRPRLVTHYPTVTFFKAFCWFTVEDIFTLDNLLTAKYVIWPFWEQNGINWRQGHPKKFVTVVCLQNEFISLVTIYTSQGKHITFIK